ncbi:hypothetical protein ID866_11578 [Astraeus odoratus]|nr:hypothetical protein ID866_11578 [Astraeus odoratus]
MSSPCHTSSPHKCCLAKTKAPGECMEEEWQLVSEVEKRAWEEAECLVHKEAAKKAQEEAEQKAHEEAEQRAQEEAKRKAEEEHRVQEVAARAKEDMEREDAMWRAVEAAEERADTERRALKEHLWEAAGPSATGQRASGVQDPCTRCHNKGTLCDLGAAKGRTMACEACCHKWAQWSEEMEDIEMIEAGKDNNNEEVWLHFMVPPHLMEDHWDAFRALTTMLDKLSTDFLTFWSNDLKEEEMGKSKGKGKEKAKEEFRGLRTDDDRDMEMGGVGLLSLV